MSYYAGSCDVAVIGAGHAGIEAALAAARLGNHTILFTINLDAVGNMPCNPAIGGTGKGHLVRELDALGGEMGAAADHACIQYRMLNRGKGPAVHSLRAQADRVKYRQYMKHTLELQENLELKQAQIVEILTAEGAVTGVRTQLGAEYGAKAVVIATGTYLDSTVITGQSVIPSGPDGMHPSVGLADHLRALGLHLRRFKTGTPPRVNRRSIDFSKMEVQPGDETAEPFSFRTTHKVNNSAVCYLTYTNEETHRIIRENLYRSPMYDGTISGVGPRYCPSIETKIVRFPDKTRHQLFVEPCGENTEELYIQGFSSSMPEEVQLAMLHTVPGLERAEVMRPGCYCPESPGHGGGTAPAHGHAGGSSDYCFQYAPAAGNPHKNAGLRIPAGGRPGHGPRPDPIRHERTVPNCCQTLRREPTASGADHPGGHSLRLGQPG